MKLAFSTLGCPKWDIETICRKAVEYGYDGIDWRGIGEYTDITISPAFTANRASTVKKIKASGIQVSGISSSIRLCEAANWNTNIEEAKRTIDLAAVLDAHHVRVFCGGDPSKTPREELAKVGADCMRSILNLPGARSILWGMETHDHWIPTKYLHMVLDLIDDPNVGVVWDICHSPRFAGESPREVVSSLGKRIIYTHVKDCVKDPTHPAADTDGWRYVLPGQGQIPLAEAIGLLKDTGYNGWLTFEHEKRWIPLLPEPEEVFPAFVQWANTFRQTFFA